MIEAGLRPNIVVDCSHANSNKDPEQQIPAFRDVLQQRVEGNTQIIGMMLESNLSAGNQSLGDDPSELKYGVWDLTDACIDWEQTEMLLRKADAAMSQILGQSASTT